MVEQAGGEGWWWAWASCQRRSEREAEEERHGGDRRVPVRGRRQATGMGPAVDGNGWIRPLGTGSDRMWARTARAAQIRAKNGGGRELRRTPCGGATKHEDLRDTGRERELCEREMKKEGQGRERDRVPGVLNSGERSGGSAGSSGSSSPDLAQARQRGTTVGLGTAQDGLPIGLQGRAVEGRPRGDVASSGWAGWRRCPLGWRHVATARWRRWRSPSGGGGVDLTVGDGRGEEMGIGQG